MGKDRTSHRQRARATITAGRAGLTVEMEVTPAGLLAIGATVSGILLSSAAIVVAARLPRRRGAVRLGAPRAALPSA